MLHDPKHDLDQASLHLLAAADLIDRGGWCQHVYEDGDRHCMMGAMLAVTNEDSEAIHEMMLKLGIAAWNVELWNDKPGRKHSEVVSWLRAAAFA
jgi:hypothetical protein